VFTILPYRDKISPGKEIPGKREESLKIRVILAATAIAVTTAVVPTATASATPRGEVIGYQYTGKLVLSGSPDSCLSALPNDDVVAGNCGGRTLPEGSHQTWYMYYTIRYTGVTGVFHGSITLLLEHKAQYLSIKLGTTKAIVFDTAVLVSFENLTKNHWLIRTLAGTALSGKSIEPPNTEQVNWLKYKTRGQIQTWQPEGGVWKPVGEIT
jgi:hypothetical protein